MESIWKSSQEANNYDQSRPDYPFKVVEIALAYLREMYDGPLTMALDIGCGTGKSTEHLISLFDNVVGCDPSSAMLEEARKNYVTKGNVKFIQASAEDLSMFPSNSMQLIFASRCIHYFDHKKFFAEVDRLLVPNGVLVYYTLQFEELHHPTKPLQFLTSLYDEYLENWIGDYWSQPKHLPPGFKFQARNRKQYYLDILQPPYPDSKKTETFKIERLLTLQTIRNLLLSYSATINYKDTHGVEASNNLVDKCVTNIKKALESNEEDENLIEMKVSNEFYMVLSRKPKN